MTAFRRELFYLEWASSDRVTWNGLMSAARRAPVCSCLHKLWMYARYHQYIRTSCLAFGLSGGCQSFAFGWVFGGSPAYGQTGLRKRSQPWTAAIS
jgi:hypothetical protein